MEELLDFATKARELGITEAALRAKVLSRTVTPFAYVSNEHAEGTQDEFLPVWSREKFPFVRWTDHGSVIEANERRLELGVPKKPGTPRYTVSGWVVLSSHTVGELLADKREVNLHNHWIGIYDAEADGSFRLLVHGKSVYIKEEDGGYYDSRGTQLTAQDIYFLPEPAEEKAEEVVDRRREKSLLRVIRALDVMAGLPDRGAPTAVERQLQQLGFRGPNDETIRKIIEEARALPPDKG